MKTIKLYFLTLLLFQFYSGSGQQFWLTTNEFWGGPKTGIAKINDSIMFVSTTDAVLRSTNQFQSLEKSLDASAIYSLFATKQGKVLAGGTGKVFVSEDSGITWDSVGINTIYPIKQFIENSSGELFAITGVYEDGDGVFFSSDEGKNWEQKNDGLGSYLGCDKVAIDKNDRLYLAMSDPDTYGFGGLFSSEDNGSSWQKVTVNIDSIGNNIRIGVTTNLSVLPTDSVYLSFYGSGGNFAVELNIYKSINDMTTSDNWHLLKVKNYTVWGMDEPLNNIFMAQNGDWYSSIDGNMYSSGTCFSKEGTSWEVLEYGLGLNEFGKHSEHFFIETENGKIFMIQMLDERIYKTDKSILTGTPLPIQLNKEITVYPNPVMKGEKIKMKLNGMKGYKNIAVYDLTGKLIFNTITEENLVELSGMYKEGVYIVSIRNNDSMTSSKIIIQ